jgi:hypothetical protein
MEHANVQLAFLGKTAERKPAPMIATHMDFVKMEHAIVIWASLGLIANTDPVKTNAHFMEYVKRMAPAYVIKDL